MLELNDRGSQFNPQGMVGIHERLFIASIKEL